MLPQALRRSAAAPPPNWIEPPLAAISRRSQILIRDSQRAVKFWPDSTWSSSQASQVESSPARCALQS
jgi:hypothetical protein